MQIYHNDPDETRLRPLQWLDLRVFYIRLGIHSVKNYSYTPESLTLYHVPLEPETLLEVSGVRAPLHSDGIPTLLKRDRLDKKTEDITFVGTDNVRTTGSVKFEVLDGPMLVLSGSLETSHGRGPGWAMSCELGSGVSKGLLNGAVPAVEVFVGGSFSGSPVALCKNLKVGLGKKQLMRGMLECVPGYEVAKGDDGPSALTLWMRDYSKYKGQGIKYVEGEDGEISSSWFNAGVGVGLGIGIGIGIGIGFGLLINTYKGTTKFSRRLM